MERRDFIKILGAGATTAALASCGMKKDKDLDSLGHHTGDVPTDKMTYRKNPTTGDRVSLLGFGMMRLPDKPQKPSKDDTPTPEEIDQEEVNRLVIDGLSDLLFTAGVSNSSITNREGAEQSKVYRVGNILLDNLRFNHARWQRPAIMDELQLEEGKYIVFTINRKALLENKENLKKMLDTMVETVGEKQEVSIPVIAPLRGKALDVVSTINCQLSTVNCQLKIVPPLPYLEFGYLTSHAMGIITDSGNVAEEATFNGVPCITLNSYTEHIETVKQGSNVLVGEDAEQLKKAMRDLLDGNWKKCSLPDRWDGRTAERIVQILRDTVITK